MPSHYTDIIMSQGTIHIKLYLYILFTSSSTQFLCFNVETVTVAESNAFLTLSHFPLSLIIFISLYYQWHVTFCNIQSIMGESTLYTFLATK